MIYTQPTSPERLNIRYTIARLLPLKELLSKAVSNMEKIALSTQDANMRKSILGFVSETAPCGSHIQSIIASLSHVFPVNNITNVTKNNPNNYSMLCPFECAGFYEIKIVKLFRDVLNDYRVIEEVRQVMRTQLNEVLYSFLKVRLLANFSKKELAAEASIF